jgi:hypothetical protein
MTGAVYWSSPGSAESDHLFNLITMMLQIVCNKNKFQQCDFCALILLTVQVQPMTSTP